MGAPMWCPGIRAIPASLDGGSMVGPSTARLSTQHTFETTYDHTAVWAAQYLNAHGLSPHIAFNPRGGAVQMIPANRAGRALANRSGGVQTNRYGKYHIQWEVVGFARRPWTLDLNRQGREDLEKLVKWQRDLGIPDRLAGLGFYPYPPDRSYRRDQPNGHSGWTGHQRWKENTHLDPGLIDLGTIFKPGGLTVADINTILARLTEIEKTLDKVNHRVYLNVSQPLMNSLGMPGKKVGDGIGIDELLDRMGYATGKIRTNVATILANMADKEGIVQGVLDGLAGQTDVTAAEIVDELAKRLTTG